MDGFFIGSFVEFGSYQYGRIVGVGFLKNSAESSDAMYAFVLIFLSFFPFFDNFKNRVVLLIPNYEEENADDDERAGADANIGINLVRIL